MSDSVVAIDVGGTTVKGARYDADATREAHRSVPTPTDPAAVVDSIAALIESLIEPGTVSVGVVVPGVVDPVAGVARYAANLGWRDVALGSLLSARLSRRVAIDHDVTAATRTVSGANPSVGSLLFVSIGTGIAAGYAVDGTVWRGASGQAGELGHTCVVPDGELCACGQLGCLEVYASGAGIARRYRAAGGETGLGTGDIVLRLSGDPVAAQVWSEAVQALGSALATAVLLLDPALIVIGGGVAQAGSALLDPVRPELSRRLQWRSAPDIRTAPVDAGLRGAARLAWDSVGLVRAEVSV